MTELYSRSAYRAQKSKRFHVEHFYMFHVKPFKREHLAIAEISMYNMNYETENQWRKMAGGLWHLWKQKGQKQ